MSAIGIHDRVERTSTVGDVLGRSLRIMRPAPSALQRDERLEAETQLAYSKRGLTNLLNTILCLCGSYFINPFQNTVSLEEIFLQTLGCETIYFIHAHFLNTH